MNIQGELALMLVEELRKRGVLQNVICAYEIETLRSCDCCGNLMNEGWMYAGIETYCCDECLLKAHPDEDLEFLRMHACEDDSDTYWTCWEG